MRIKIYLFAFVIIVLSIFQASVSEDTETTSCETRETEVNVTATTSEEFAKLFAYNMTLNESLSIEKQIIEEAFSANVTYNEDQDLNITELITKYGFTPEVHEVTTKDGYVLTMHRIVGNGSVVFMMHGLSSSSVDWVTAGPGNSLAFELASAGYDVWMGNARGTKYSMTHTSLSPECDEFWEFSVDEVNIIDLPSMIDYALNVTGKSYFSYVGYSQGTYNLAALCSEMPEYNEKISIAVLLAPSVYMSNWKSPFFRLISLNPEALYKFMRMIGLTDAALYSEDDSSSGLCGNDTLSIILCSNLIGMTFGYSRGQLNIARLPVFFSHFPGGSSIRQTIHNGQNGRTGKFQKFIFTKEKNLEVYGTEEAPEYKAQNLTAPVAIFYGNTDWVVDLTDAKQFIDELPNVVNATLLENFNHADYLWSKNNKELVNDPVVELISKYEK